MSKSLFNILDLVAQIFIFIALIYWFEIIALYLKEMNKNDEYLFYEMETRAIKISYYIEIQSISIFCLLLQTIKFLNFFPQIAKLLDILTAAKFDFLFFIILFYVILLAFATLGFFVFGINVSGFENYEVATLSCLELILGSNSIDKIFKINPQMATLFYFLLMVITFHKIFLLLK